MRNDSVLIGGFLSERGCRRHVEPGLGSLSEVITGAAKLPLGHKRPLAWQGFDEAYAWVYGARSGLVVRGSVPVLAAGLCRRPSVEPSSCEIYQGVNGVECRLSCGRSSRAMAMFRGCVL